MDTNKERSVSRSGTFLDISIERWRQLDKWGEQSHRDDTGMWYEPLRDEYQRVNDKTVEFGGSPGWANILLEEIYEALSEEDPEKIREELVQACAVAVAWIEDIDTRE